MTSSERVENISYQNQVGESVMLYECESRAVCVIRNRNHLCRKCNRRFSTRSRLEQQLKKWCSTHLRPRQSLGSDNCWPSDFSRFRISGEAKTSRSSCSSNLPPNSNCLPLWYLRVELQCRYYEVIEQVFSRRLESGGFIAQSEGRRSARCGSAPVTMNVVEGFFFLTSKQDSRRRWHLRLRFIRGEISGMQVAGTLERA
ncbi:uncharacterized protein BDZ99DRAFT_171872 [Mytilinidion resinicola]|uniref:C2H2-type domain-containing protein n=1 Tax=Mytilinidion resinicola TaxID=574789 RepID=A0A6A6Y589_9PEZI|nr:uncharacterized protein BDZ99DRAFT_171872 [Mytilinidion resinicola]KAF2803395.1 hypothetical protein BDZ99DRAFT_171872 [Mytilinidion resinicola]